MAEHKAGKVERRHAEPSRPRRFDWFPPAVVGIVTFIAFAPALKNGFVWDDVRNLLENVHYRGLGWSQLRWMSTTFHLAHVCGLGP